MKGHKAMRPERLLVATSGLPGSKESCVKGAKLEGYGEERVVRYLQLKI